jgi:hypothetical protein
MGHRLEGSTESQERLLKEYIPAKLDPRMEDRRQKNSRATLKLWATLTGLLAAFAVVLSSISLSRTLPTMYGSFHRGSSSPNTTWLSCGHNVTAARAAGCKFDVMLSAWLPPPCYDEELMENTLAVENFSWFYDKEFTKPVSEEQVRAGGPHKQLFTRRDFHYKHCAYVWIKQIKVWREGSWIDENAWKFEHTVHCASSLLSLEHGFSHNYTVNNVVYYRCGRPWRDDWKREIEG